MVCRGKGPLRCDAFDLGNDPRIKKGIRDTAVGGPDVEREDEFARSPFVRRTRDGHGWEMVDRKRGALTRNRIYQVNGSATL